MPQARGADMEKFSIDEILELMIMAGVPMKDLEMMAAIALAESRNDPEAVGDEKIADENWGPSLGLMQIRSRHEAFGTGGPRDSARIMDPTENIRAALEIYRGGNGEPRKGWRPWSVYNDGKYRAELPEVQAGMTRVWDRFTDPSRQSLRD